MHSPDAREGSGLGEEFLLVDVDEVAGEPVQQPQRRTGRLARLLGRSPWRRVAAAPSPAGAGALLTPIPIVSLTASGDGCTIDNPLNDATPQGSAGSCPAGAAGQPAQQDSAALGEATVGTWLQAQPTWGLRPSSHAGSSLCSGISICSASEPGSGGSSVAHSRNSSCSWPPGAPAGKARRYGDGSSSGSSSSRLLNKLMLQAEAGSEAATVEPQLLPAAAAAECTPNPLLQQQEQAALLSWRRHAWHAAEQRQPELLHRLLSPAGWDEEQAAADGPNAASPPLTSSGMPSAASRPSKGATFGRLLAIIAALAIAVLLLHAAHSDAAHRKLTEPWAAPAVYGEAAVLGGYAGLTPPGVGSLLGSSSRASLQPALLDPGTLSQPVGDGQSPAPHRLPRRRLRLRRIVLLIEWE